MQTPIIIRRHIFSNYWIVSFTYGPPMIRVALNLLIVEHIEKGEQFNLDFFDVVAEPVVLIPWSSS